MVRVHNADIIATLLLLKREVELSTGTSLKLTLVGATEAHLLAKEIAAANVGVILLPPRSFPYTWEMRKMQVLLYFYYDRPEGVYEYNFNPAFQVHH